MASNIYSKSLLYEVDWDVFRARLKELMDSRGYSLADLSRATGLSISTLSRYFYERTPDLTAALLLADHFGVTLDWLFGRSGTRYLDEIADAAKDLYNAYMKTGGTDRIVIDTILAKYK